MNKIIPCFLKAATPLLTALPLLLFTAGSAQSTPVTWTLDNAVFDDGGQANGSLVYDDDTHTLISADITTTAGSTVTFETHYTSRLLNNRSTTSHLRFYDGFFSSD